MKKSKRAERNLSVASEWYSRLRVAAYTLAYMNTLNSKSAFSCVSDAFTSFTIKANRLSKSETADMELMSLVFKNTVSVKSVRRDADCPELLENIHDSIPTDSLNVWILSVFASMGNIGISSILGIPSADVQNKLSEANSGICSLCEASNTTQAYAKIRSIIQKRCSAEDPWNDVVFKVNKHYNVGRRIELAILGIFAAIGIFFALREAYLFVAVSSLPRFDPPNNALSLNYDDPDYWRIGARLDSELSPNISQSLLDVLNTVSDDTVIRVDFSFYDKEIMDSYLTDDGRTLTELYIDTFTDTRVAADLDIAITVSIIIYYAKYDMPPSMPIYRDEDFVPNWASLYDCVFSYIDRQIRYRQPSLQAVFDSYSEVFASKESFNEYLINDFSNNAYWLSELVYYEVLMDDYRSNPSAYSPEEAYELRESYELAIFKYFNGELKAYLPSAMKITSEQLAYLLFNRNEIGANAGNEMDAMVRSFGFKNLCDNSIANSSICSYTADLTKAEIMHLALEDGRFIFDGVAFSAIQSNYPSNIDPLLYSMLGNDAEDSGEYEIMIVDDIYHDYSLNEMIKITLPQGFINELHELVPEIEFSTLELTYGYTCRVLYGHKRVYSEYQSLRAAILHANDFIASTKYKRYTTVGRVN